jgi:prepilin signal peptidase PulO-like enzyme (type II secretory pathway)
MLTVTVFVEGYLVLLGLVAGSFINLASDRLPRGESLVAPRSHCRSCDRVLNAVDLLPVAGYLLRGGRCATCRAPIGAWAPIVELVSGLLMVATITWLGVWPGTAAGLALVGAWGALVTSLAIYRHSPVRVLRSKT